MQDKQVIMLPITITVSKPTLGEIVVVKPLDIQVKFEVSKPTLGE